MILNIENITKSYNGLQAVRQVSLTIEQGRITGLVGGNGAGKTTLFNLISGMEKADRGAIYYDQRDISNMSALKRARAGIGRLWQTPRIFRNLDLLENLLVATKNHPGERFLNYFHKQSVIREVEKRNVEKAYEILTIVRLLDKKYQLAGEISLGEQKLLSLGMLLMNEASLLLLDEPLSGVNLVMIDVINEVLVKLAAEGKTFFIIEHNIKKLLEIANQIYVIQEGAVVRHLTGKEMNLENIIKPLPEHA